MEKIEETKDYELYKAEVKEENGEHFIEIPEEIMDKCGLKQGDKVNISTGTDGKTGEKVLLVDFKEK